MIKVNLLIIILKQGEATEERCCCNHSSTISMLHKTITVVLVKQHVVAVWKLDVRTYTALQYQSNQPAHPQWFPPTMTTQPSSAAPPSPPLPLPQLPRSFHPLPRHCCSWASNILKNSDDDDDDYDICMYLLLFILGLSLYCLWFKETAWLMLYWLIGGQECVVLCALFEILRAG